MVSIIQETFDGQETFKDALIYGRSTAVNDHDMHLRKALQEDYSFTSREIGAYSVFIIQQFLIL